MILSWFWAAFRLNWRGRRSCSWWIVLSIARGFFELFHGLANTTGQLRHFLASKQQENDDQHKKDVPLAYNGYVAFVPEKDALRFWALVPDVVLGQDARETE